MERAIGHRFRQRELLDRALTHRSAVPCDDARLELPADNEQLEYLGDAVLGLLASEHLIRMFSNWNEGQLSKSRARLVNAPSLSAAARRLQLGKYLHLGKGEEKTGGREKPALLANAFEAVIAAVYLDGGLRAVRKFVKRALLDAALEAHGSGLELPDHKSALQEFLQSKGLPAARYAVIRETGPDHQKTFWIQVDVPGLVTATATGPTKKKAEQSGAAEALQHLRAEKEKIG